MLVTGRGGGEHERAGQQQRRPPAPCTSRAPLSTAIVGAAAHAADETVNTSSPATKARLAPKVSVIAPAPSITAANESV
ncbi:hypothetical protein GCM10020001_015870 [Nonomuraea salmonea]